MDNIRSELRKEYKRWTRKVDENCLSKNSIIKIDDVLRAHFLLCDY